MLGVSRLGHHSLELQMVVHLICHHWKILLPGQFTELEIEHQINKRFHVISRSQVTAHELVIRSKKRCALKFKLFFLID